MENHNNFEFLIEPPSELDAKVFAKITPVLKENRQIRARKQWFQLWIPVASTTALTAFSFWFFKNKSKTDSLVPQSADPEIDFPSFAALALDEENWELAGNLEIIEELELLESYSEDEG